eukprot:5122465-Amphidinium_carterae.2
MAQVAACTPVDGQAQHTNSEALAWRAHLARTRAGLLLPASLAAHQKGEPLPPPTLSQRSHP